MKEIDFIPEWYTANQNRKRRYHRQYLLLCALLAVMMGWSFFVGQYIERVRADVEDIQSVFEKGKTKVTEGMALEADIAALRHQATILEAVTPRTPVSTIMAEVSWLIQENIVLTKLAFMNETIDLDKEQSSAPTASVVQMGAPARENDAAAASLATKRIRVTLSGIAAKPADAAGLICRLEESDYFEQVVPVYTKARKVKEYDATEFEIRMFVADYKIRKQEYR
jgi:hypothetical protein